MRCRICGKKIVQTVITQTWYHRKTRNVYCFPNALATPNEKKKHVD